MKRLMLIAAAALMLATGSRKDAYILSIGPGLTTISGSNVEQIVRVSRRFSGRYVWVNRGGREYIINDETTIAQAQALFAEEMALAPEQERVNREESRLDHEVDRLEDRDEDGAPLTAAEKNRLADLREQLRAVARREREIDRKQEALEREAERGLWQLVDEAIRAGVAKPLGR